MIFEITTDKYTASYGESGEGYNETWTVTFDGVTSLSALEGVLQSARFCSVHQAVRVTKTGQHGRPTHVKEGGFFLFRPGPRYLINTDKIIEISAPDHYRFATDDELASIDAPEGRP